MQKKLDSVGLGIQFIRGILGCIHHGFWCVPCCMLIPGKTGMAMAGRHLEMCAAYSEMLGVMIPDGEQKKTISYYAQNFRDLAKEVWEH